MRSVRARMCGITTSLAEMWRVLGEEVVLGDPHVLPVGPVAGLGDPCLVDQPSVLEGVVAPVEVVGHPATDEESELHGGMIADLTPRQGTDPDRRRPGIEIRYHDGDGPAHRSSERLGCGPG